MRQFNMQPAAYIPIMPVFEHVLSREPIALNTVRGHLSGFFEPKPHCQSIVYPMVFDLGRLSILMKVKLLLVVVVGIESQLCRTFCKTSFSPYHKIEEDLDITGD